MSLSWKTYWPISLVQSEEATQKKGILKNFCKFHTCFPVKFEKFLRKIYFEEHLRTTASNQLNDTPAIASHRFFQELF